VATRIVRDHNGVQRHKIQHGVSYLEWPCF